NSRDMFQFGISRYVSGSGEPPRTYPTRGLLPVTTPIAPAVAQPRSRAASRAMRRVFPGPVDAPGLPLFHTSGVPLRGRPAPRYLQRKDRRALSAPPASLVPPPFRTIAAPRRDRGRRPRRGTA